MNLCARCETDFKTAGQFDAHPCMVNPDGLPVLRERRRTSLVTIGPDTVRVCDPECRDEFLLDLGLKGSGGGSAFRSHGQADVHVEWNGRDYRVTWKRCPPSALHCDLCAHEWRYRPGPRRRELTPVQRAAFAANMGRGFVTAVKAPDRENAAL